MPPVRPAPDEFDDAEVSSSDCEPPNGSDEDDVEVSEDMDHSEDDAAAAANDEGALAVGEKTSAVDDPLSMSTPSSDAAIFQLQIEELLNESRVNYKAEDSISSFVKKLKKAIALVPSGQVISGDIASGFISQLGLDPKEVSLPMGPPASTHVIGSFALQCVARPEAVVDIAVVIPEDCLYKKAYLNYRYHARRALYLAALGAHLSQSADGLFANQELRCLHDDPTRPLLLIRPSLNTAASKNSPAGFLVRLIPVLSPHAFVASKLGPARNSVRSVCKPASGQVKGKGPEGGAAAGAAARSAKGKGSEGGAAAAGAAAGAAKGKGSEGRAAAGAVVGAAVPLATPMYNQSILQDMMWMLHNLYLRRCFRSTPRIVDGIVLLKVWLRQRGLSGPDGPTGHMLSMLMATLLDRGKLSAAMTPLQMLRSALHMLSDKTGSGLGRGLAMSLLVASNEEEKDCCPAVSSEGCAPSLTVFKQHFDVVFIDPSGWLNLAANMSKSAMSQIQSCARQTLALLEVPPDPEEAFHQAFMLRSSPASAFDYCWRVRLPDTAASKAGDSEDSPCSICKDRLLWREQEAQVETLIRQALSERAKLVHVVRRRLAPGQLRSTLSQGLPRLECMTDAVDDNGGTILVGANVDPTTALRLVDIGPAADDLRAAAKFRAFWGERSELRRFQDGKISEAVFWDLPPAERHCIMDRIVEYAAEVHLPAGTRVYSCASAFDATLDEAEASAGDGIASFRMSEAAFDKLGKQLRTLDTIALKVVGVQPISSVSRQTAPFFPRPHPLAGGAAAALENGPLARCLEPIEVLVQLEGSGRWPDDPTAFRKMKAALGLQLAEALQRAHACHCSASEDAVDVLMDGFAFRLVVYSGRDEAMLSKLLLTSKRAHADLSAEEYPLLRNWHHGLVTLVAGANPAYSPSVRLARRWVGAHLLSNHICGEAVELIVAAAFIIPSPHGQPASRMAGFLRFLQLLATHPWAQRPLVVDPEKQMTQAVRRQLQRRFDERRSAGKVPALYLCTPRDLESSHWTGAHPTADVMKHAVSLASKAARLLQALVEHGAALPKAAPAQGGSDDDDGDDLSDADHAADAESAFLSVFVTPLEDYDCLLLLSAEALPQAGRALPLLHPTLQQHLEKEAAIASQGGKRRKGASGMALLHQQPDVLTAVEVAGADAASKRSRAFLNAFPQQVVTSHGPSKLRQELLIGFDPLTHLLEALEERFGHMATFCADHHGGVPVVAIKWSPLAFIPSQPKVASYHGSLACQLTAAAASAVVPNISAILSEMCTLGEGIVCDVMFLASCGRVKAL